MANANRGLGKGLGALLGDAALTEVSDREESGIQQMAPWQNGYYCVTEEGLTHRRL